MSAPLKTTAIGKSIKTTVWILAAYAVTIVTAAVARYHWPVSDVTLGIPGIVNILLFALSQFFDRTVPNFPGSTPVAVVAPPPASTGVGGVIAG
jgi:hypothetical protein